MSTTEQEAKRAPRAQRIAEGAALRDEGTAQVENGSDPRVILTIDAKIQKAIDSGRPFSANDIRDDLPVSDEHLVGARILSFAGRRIEGRPVMRKVGLTPSSLPSTHHHNIGVWLGSEALREQEAADTDAPPRRPVPAPAAAEAAEQDTFALLEESPA